MASITIRNLDDDVKTQLRIRASTNGRSMEEEARLIQREAVGRKAGPQNLASTIRARFAPLGGMELDIPARRFRADAPMADQLTSGTALR